MAKKEKNVELQDNELDVQINKGEEFVQKNQKMIFGVCAAIVVAVAAIWGWNKLSDSKNASAQNEMWEAQALFDQGQYEQALAGFEAVADEYGSTKAGNLAKAYAGLCQKNLGNFEEAVKLLDDYDGNDNVVAPAILSAMGDCLVNMENADNKKAADTFMKAAKAADNAQYSPLYLKKAGLAYEAAGDNEAAVKAYQAIKDNWAETTLAQTIDKYIERVK